MLTILTTSVLSIEDAKRAVYRENINNGETAEVKDGNGTQRYFEMNKGVLTQIPNPE